VTTEQAVIYALVTGYWTGSGWVESALLKVVVREICPIRAVPSRADDRRTRELDGWSNLISIKPSRSVRL
jgi:hypothetical protein